MGTELSEHWAAFAHDAAATGKPMYSRGFKVGNVWCRGPLDGGGCPHGHGRDVAADQALALEQIECDHVHDVADICHAWRSSLPQFPASWCDGVDKVKLFRLLFAVGPKVVFRCSKCHSRAPHYQRRLAPRSLTLHAAAAVITID